MKKFLNLILIVGVLILTGCNKKANKINNIKLDKEQYIEQLVPIKINNTNDTFKITSKVSWKVPKQADGDTTVSFSIPISYTIKVDGIEYSGVYKLNYDEWNDSDENPKYKFKVVNLNQDGDISIYVTLK